VSAAPTALMVKAPLVALQPSSRRKPGSSLSKLNRLRRWLNGFGAAGRAAAGYFLVATRK